MDSLLDLFKPLAINTLIAKIFITIILTFVISILKSHLCKLINEKTESETLAYKLKQTVQYSGNIILLVLIVQIWFSAFQSISTFLGLITAGLAIALKDLISDIAGYIYISTKKPFKVGDRIEISGIKGDVINVSLLHFTLLEIGNWVQNDQSTGRIVHLPASQILDKALFNYNKGFNWIWNEIEFLVTSESDWKKVKLDIQNISESLLEKNINEIKKDMKKAKREMLVRFENISPIIYTNSKDSGINLTLRYLCRPKEKRFTETLIWEAILDLTEKNDYIDLAYPTQRIQIDK